MIINKKYVLSEIFYAANYIKKKKSKITHNMYVIFTQRY